MEEAVVFVPDMRGPPEKRSQYWYVRQSAVGSICNQARIALKQLERTSGCIRKLMLALSPIPMFDRKDHPSVPTCCPWRKAAGGGQGGPQAIAKRREASLRATHRLATLGDGGRSVMLPLPTIPHASRNARGEARQQPDAKPVNHRGHAQPGMDRRPASYSSTEPTPLNRA